MQETDWLTVGEDGVQLMLLIVGATGGSVTITWNWRLLSLPPELLAVR